MVVIGCHTIVNICSEDELLFLSGAAHGKLDGDEGRVLDRDAAALDRCYQPVGARLVSPEDRAEKAYQRHSGDWRTAIEPGTITGDVNAEIAAIPGRRPPPAAGCRGGGSETIEWL